MGTAMYTGMEKVMEMRTNGNGNANVPKLSRAIAFVHVFYFVATLRILLACLFGWANLLMDGSYSSGYENYQQAL